MEIDYRYKIKKINFRLLNSLISDIKKIAKPFSKTHYSLELEYKNDTVKVESLSDLYKEWEDRRKKNPEEFHFFIYAFKTPEDENNFNFYFKIVISGRKEEIRISVDGPSKEFVVSLHNKIQEVFELDFKKEEDEIISLQPVKKSKLKTRSKYTKDQPKEKWYKLLWDRWWVKALLVIIAIFGIIFAIYTYKRPSTPPSVSIPPKLLETSIDLFVKPADSIKKAEQNREELRVSRNLRELQPLETGKYLEDASFEVYGFGDSIDIGVYKLKPEKIRFSKSHYEFRDFEIHKLSDGKFFLIGFVNDENSAKLSTKIEQIDFVLFSDPRADIKNLVSIPFGKIRDINHRVVEFEERISVLDIKI